MAVAAIPAFVYWAGLAVSVGSAAYGAYSAKQTANVNEKMAEADAVYQGQKAAFESRQKAREGARVIAAQKTGYAKAGVSLLSSSVHDVASDSYEEMAVDAMAIKYGGDIAAMKSRNAASNYRAEGKAAVIQGVGQAGSSLMTNKYALGG